MPISDSQLTTWAKSYDTEAARNAHKAVRRAMELHRSSDWLANKTDYLQGSYRNATSVFRDSDVDLVLEWTRDSYNDISSLSAPDSASFQRDNSKATYNFDAFRSDVIDALTRHFGREAVDVSGNKSIKVAAKYGERLASDVIPCFQYRRYTAYRPENVTYDAGIAFFTQLEGRMVINFPKQHIENGWAKNAATGEWYKRTVRQFKNARNCAVANGLLENGTAPSYFVECLLFNVPNDRFGGGYGPTFVDPLLWLAGADLSRATCQNRLDSLFGSGGEQWDEIRAERFIQALRQLYAEWS